LRIVRGKKIEKDDLSLREMASGYASVVVDLGTGDGRFVYKMARQYPNKLFIGVDAAAENMMEYSLRALKKPDKGGAANAVYLAASAEDLPPQLDGLAHEIYVILPWGSLLEGIVKGGRAVLDGLARIARPGAVLDLFFTYSHLHEEGEISKRELPGLSLAYIEDTLTPLYRECGIVLSEKEIIGNEELRLYETHWARKLGFGKSRTVFHVKGAVHRPGG
jgi:16S rRNA (adenine(1408)-N(1))-methyltransferase